MLTVELQQGAPNPSPSAGAAAAVGGSPHKPLGPPPRRGEAEVDRLRVVYRRAWAEAMLRWAAEVGEDLRQAEAGWERCVLLAPVFVKGGWEEEPRLKELQLFCLQQVSVIQRTMAAMPSNRTPRKRRTWQFL